MELKKEFKARSQELLGSDAEEYFKILEEPLKDSLRVNTLKISIKALISRLESKGWILQKVPWCDEGYWVHNGTEKLGNTLEHFLGYYYAQEPASMIPPLLMELKEGQKILDMCASPGSKTGQIAGLTNDEGLIIANDVSVDRVSILKYNMQRIGVRSIIITRRNAMNYARVKGFFDRVLLDAPCSGEGVIRRNPYVAIQWNHANLRGFSREQKALALSAYDTLKPGGTLVYSTCSLAPEENEEVIDTLVSKGALIEQVKLKGLITRPGINSWQGKKYSEEVTKTARIYPQDNDTEGFFVAKVKKE